MPNLKVKSHNGTRDWTGNYGPMVDHNLTITVDGKDFDVYMTKKPDSPAPQAGESFEFEKVKQDDHGIKIKRVYDKPYDANSNGNTGGGGGGRTSDRMIAAQVAAKCAAEVLAGYATSGKVLPTAVDADKLTGEFLDAILKHGQEPAQTTIGGASDPSTMPADTTGLDDTGPQEAAALDASPTNDDDIPF